MRVSFRYLANPVSTVNSSNPLKAAPFALLPPIPLYRRLFRAHRHKLGPEERVLGDQYIKSEFRQHRDIENPVHIIGFLTEWQLYAQKLEGDAWKDDKMDKQKLDKMSDQLNHERADEQIGQLYELMQAIKAKNDQDTE